MTFHALHSDALHSDALHSDALHSDALHSDALHSDALHSDALHCDMDSLDVHRWEQVSRLFEAAQEQPPGARTAFVRHADVDEAVRAEVEALLAVADDAAGFFDDLAENVGAPVVSALARPFADGAAVETGAADEEPLLTPGDRAGRYEILEVLGRGGMGVVYAARDARLNRRVALKMTAAAPPDDGVRARFVREARAASALDHPHICTIFDAGQRDDGRAYLVMACYDGETLRDRLRRGPLPLADALAVTRQVASGLVAAHAAGIVHRDLKPANVMLTPGQGVKLLDFGIAKLRSVTALTSSTRALGTVGYVAPEQIRGDDVSGAADVWALGVLLYEMLAGRRPFDGTTPASVLYAILETDPPPLDAVAADVPSSVVRLVHRCLRKDPADRPTAHDVRDAIADPDADSAASKRPARSRTTQTRAAWTGAAGLGGAVWLGLVACGLVALGLVAVVAWTQLARTESARDAPPVVAVLPFEVRGDSSLAYLREGMVDLLSTQLDGVAGLRVADPNRLLGVVGAADVRDPARAHVWARRVDASQVVVGQVLSLGAGFRLSAALYTDAEAPPVRAQADVARPHDLLDGLDRLARDLVAGILDAPAERMAGLAAHTTTSFPALRAYLRGEHLARDGRFPDAFDAYAEAVAADSTFALAWYRLARAAGWMGAPTLNAQALERAVRLSTDLPGRARSIIEAYDAFRNGSPREAERRYRAILAHAPDDAETWYLFGEALFHNNPAVGRSTAEARHPFTRAAMYDPDNRELLVHLMDLAAREERWTALDTLTTRYLRPDSGRVALRAPYRLLRALTLEPSDTRAAAWEELADAGPDAMYAALIRVGPQLKDLDVSLRLAALLTEPRHADRWRIEGHIHIGRLEAARGRWQAAERAFRAADALAPGVSDVHRAIAVVASGAPDAAVQAVYNDLVRTAPPPPDARPRNIRPRDIRPPDARGSAGQDPVVTRAFVLGWLQAHLGNEARMRTHAKALWAKAAPSGDSSGGDALAGSLASTLEAAWAVQAGRWDAALDALDAAALDVPFHVRESDPLHSQTHLRVLRADALAANGRFEDALRWYAAAHDGYYHWATPALAMTTRRQAALHARLGRTSDAVAAYRRVLGLWSDADAAFDAAVRDVRARIDALRSQAPFPDPPP